MSTASPPPARHRYGFLASRRWLVLIATMLLVAALCVRLGMWQWDRYAERSAEVEQISAAFDDDPVPAAELLGADARVTPNLQWRPVELTGHYLTEATVLLRNRPVEGTAAVHVLTPFLADVAGQQVLVVVNRGWLRAEAGLVEEPDVPPAPEGEVTVVGRLRPPEPAWDRTAPAGQVYRLDVGQVMAAAAAVTDVSAAEDARALAGYVQLVEQDPAVAEAPEPFPPPGTDLGPHVSYAVQWWIFAAGAVVGLVVLARREAQDAAGDGGAPRARRRPSAEEEEDALVEADLRRG